ncbi:hypothetical protein [Hymenobacter sp. BT730]|uniref:hypothetical protein n=1 Tax=Hymenobacter sp. BT730 TaxID=3063332 RepID=UPI0026DEE048|nr:hypothetical protein [Hymenobacter sp. BT730]
MKTSHNFLFLAAFSTLGLFSCNKESDSITPASESTVTATSSTSGNNTNQNNASAQQTSSQLGKLVSPHDKGRVVCMTAALTGLNQCVTMVHTTYTVAASGNETSVWSGTLPASLHPNKETQFNSTWFEGGKTYETKCTITPSGNIKLILHYKK